MNDAATMSDDDLVADLATAAAELTAEEFKAYFRLRDYQRTRGRELPPREKNLAVIAGVTLHAFRNMRPALSDFLPLADVHIDGASEPEKDPVKQSAGRLGAHERWKKRRDAIEAAKRAAMSSAIEPMAETMADDMADSHADRHGDAIAHGLTDRFSDSKENSKPQSVSPSNAGVGDSEMAGTGDGKLAGTADSRMAGTGGGALRGGASNLAPADPATIDDVAKAMPGVMKPTIMPSDDEIEAIVRAAARDKDGKPHLDAGWKGQGLFDRLRSWVADGLSLRDDFKPALETFAARSKGPVRNPASGEIRRMAEELRAKNSGTREKNEQHATWLANRYFAEPDTPQYRAWADHHRRKSHPRDTYEGREGWWFPSEWPPGVDPNNYNGAPLKVATG